MTSTGIPPHIESARRCHRILEKYDETLERVQNIETTVKEAVKEAY
jgi:predicted metal-binding protein